MHPLPRSQDGEVLSSQCSLGDGGGGGDRGGVGGVSVRLEDGSLLLWGTLTEAAPSHRIKTAGGAICTLCGIGIGIGSCDVCAYTLCWEAWYDVCAYIQGWLWRPTTGMLAHTLSALWTQLEPYSCTVKTEA